jgi:hypothetical protein
MGNGLGLVLLTDADGYRIKFSSPTDAPEERRVGEEMLDLRELVAHRLGKFP